MPKQLALSALIEMPDNPFQAAEVYARLREPWDALVNTLKQTGADHKVTADEIETRTKAVRRPRKPRLAQPTPDAA